MALRTPDVVGEQCWVSAERLQEQLKQLRAEVVTLGTEAATLRSCLAESGVLNLERYLSKIHRWNFAQCCAAHHWVPAAQFFDVVAEAQARSVGVLVAALDLQALRAASRLSDQIVQDILQFKNASSSHHVYILSGLNERLQVKSVERLVLPGAVWESIGSMPGDDCPVAASVLANKIYVWGTTRSTACYNIEAKSWEPMAPTLKERINPTIATFDGMLYVCGGNDGGDESLTSVERFDPAAGEWSLLPPMLAGRASAVAAVMGGELYICGGNDSWDEPLNHCEYFNPLTGAWRALPPRPVNRSVTAVAALFNQLYVFGVEMSFRRNSADCYNPASGFWEALPPLLSQRRGQGVAVATTAGCLYVCGGCTAPWSATARGCNAPRVLSSVERYCPRLRRWEEVPPMSVRRIHATIASVDGQLYVFGGLDGDEYLDTVERFDPNANAWTSLQRLPEGRAWAVAVPADS